jgi:glycosyltransferase involved in cell wall biosynthesis
MLAWEYPPHVVGGLGGHVAEIAPALAQRGVQLHVVTPRWEGGAPVERAPGLTVHRVDPPGLAMPGFYTGAWHTNSRLEEVAARLCQEEGIELIHNHDWLTVFCAAALKRTLRLPMVSTVHATELGRARGHLADNQQRAIHSAEWWLTYESWRVICCSHFMANEVATYFNLPTDKIDVIPNGVRANRFARWEGADLSLFRSMYALPWEQIVFYVGRIVQEKGLHVLLEAVPRVLAENPTAKFVIAGTGYLLDSLRSRAWELGVGQKVLFTGFIPDDDRDRLFRVASCAVFPSLYEPFGIVALEAMAAMAPVVISLVGGLQEVVKHAETGITVYPDNAESLAWGINHTLARPDWAAQRAQNAYRVVLDEHNWNRIAGQTMDVYQRVIDERAKANW